MAERTHVHHHPHHDPVGGIPPGPSLGAAAGPTPRQQDRDWQDRAVTFVKKNPAIVAGGALAVLALLGPGRTLRMASKGMMLAGMAAGAFKQMQDQNGSKSHADASLGRGEPVSHH